MTAEEQALLMECLVEIGQVDPEGAGCVSEHRLRSRCRCCLHCRPVNPARGWWLQLE